MEESSVRQDHVMGLSVRYVRLATQEEKHLTYLKNLKGTAMNFTRINNLDVITKSGSSNKAVIVLHGYGANFQDLAPLHSYLDPQQRLNWYFIDGPQLVDIGMGMTGKSWFPIDMMKLQSSLLNGTFSKIFADHEPEGLCEVSDTIIKIIDNIQSEFKDIYIGGFSQGSMVSLKVAMKAPDKVSKLFLLSSTLFNERGLDEKLSDLKAITTFQSHGQADPVLPFSMAQRLEEKLEGSISNYKFHSFNGGHEIPLEVIKELKSFLED